MRTLEALLNSSRSREVSTSNGAVAEIYAAASNGHGDVWHELRQEIARARRFGRAFALARIGRVAGAELAPHLRTVDRPWTADGATYVLLPEADREAAEGFASRLRRDAPDVIDDCAVSVAAFPDDGVTSGALLDVLRKRTKPAHELTRQPSFQRVPESPPVHA